MIFKLIFLGVLQFNFPAIVVKLRAATPETWPVLRNAFAPNFDVPPTATSVLKLNTSAASTTPNKSQCEAVWKISVSAHYHKFVIVKDNVTDALEGERERWIVMASAVMMCNFFPFEYTYTRSSESGNLFHTLERCQTFGQCPVPGLDNFFNLIWIQA
jgi:hypothetical protein